MNTLLLSFFILFIWATPSSFARQDPPSDWKKDTLQAILAQLEHDGLTDVQRQELASQRSWLKKWKPGTMQVDPARHQADSLPILKKEPVLESAQSKLIQDLTVVVDATHMQLANRSTLHQIDALIKEHSDDAALFQTALKLLDEQPEIRKQHLGRIDALSSRLIQLLRTKSGEDPQAHLALEFALYRRVRALAYRELPDVSRSNPIKDPEGLDRQMKEAFSDLIKTAGDDRAEFVLIEIRMQRRSGNFGIALEKLESNGHTISRKWYLKKRRDLLELLKWNPPYKEAASLYADEFPDAVKKERQRKQQVESGPENRN
ncbi:MAG: hypothetical protein AAFN77_23340 [Planctomycetota bacterium]